MPRVSIFTTSAFSARSAVNVSVFHDVDHNLKIQKSTLINRQSVGQIAIGCSAMGHIQTRAFHLTAELAEHAELRLFPLQVREINH
jgi:hypothetical protein